MKKFGDYILEDLSGALVEPQSNASAEAKKLGLTYVGFGRYEDRTGQVTHTVVNDRLVPFAKALKSKSYQNFTADDYGDYMKNLSPEVQQTNQMLLQTYVPENYDNDELDAIKEYTTGAYVDINRRLAGLPTGILAEQIQPEYADDKRPQLIAALDSATSKVGAPMPFTVYTNLASDFDITSIAKGSVFKFKGFCSTTTDPSIAMSQSPSQYMLQINVTKGVAGVYADDYSATPGDSEFILQRGLSLKVTSGPSKLSGSAAEYQDPVKQVVLIKCDTVVK